MEAEVERYREELQAIHKLAKEWETYGKAQAGKLAKAREEVAELTAEKGKLQASIEALTRDRDSARAELETLRHPRPGSFTAPAPSSRVGGVHSEVSAVTNSLTTGVARTPSAAVEVTRVLTGAAAVASGGAAGVSVPPVGGVVAAAFHSSL